MNQPTRVVCALLCILAIASPGSAYTWMWAGPNPVYYGGGADVAGSFTYDAWCYEWDGCYFGGSYSYVQVVGDDGFYSASESYNWPEAYTEGWDSTPGQTMARTSYYLSGGAWIDLWYCYPDIGCSEYSYWEDAGYQSATVLPDPCFPFPTSETSYHIGWGGSPAPQAAFYQELTVEGGPGQSAGGRIVVENTASRATQSNDTCFYPGSPIPPQFTLSGGEWWINGNNSWCCDYVGWPDVYPDYAVTWYRNQGRAPCQTTNPQDMIILCTGEYGSWWVVYNTSDLELGFTNSTVWGRRLGATGTTNYP